MSPATCLTPGLSLGIKKVEELADLILEQVGRRKKKVLINYKKAEELNSIKTLLEQKTFKGYLDGLLKFGYEKKKKEYKGCKILYSTKNKKYTLTYIHNE